LLHEAAERRSIFIPLRGAQKSDQSKKYINRNGVPIADNQKIMPSGPRGAVLLLDLRIHLEDGQ
jgi:catalase